jgi:peptide-methionine (S)-S-oxide reductase
MMKTNELGERTRWPQTLVVGGGCFWCTEAAYGMVPGVLHVVSGYAGGAVADPSYEAVCGGRTGHAEVVRVTFDPAVVSIDTLLDLFWKLHDPTTLNRQGADVGTQYRSVIFYADEDQRFAAEASRDRANPGWGGKIVTELAACPTFYAAEGYHQKYFERNPEAGYCQAVIRPKLEKFSREGLGA